MQEKSSILTSLMTSAVALEYLLVNVHPEGICETLRWKLLG